MQLGFNSRATHYLTNNSKSQLQRKLRRHTRSTGRECFSAPSLTWFRTRVCRRHHSRRRGGEEQTRPDHQLQRRPGRHPRLLGTWLPPRPEQHPLRHLPRDLPGCPRRAERHHPGCAAWRQPGRGHRLLYPHPCILCAKMLVNVRVKRFVSFGKYADDAFIGLFKEVGIDVDLHPRPVF